MPKKKPATSGAQDWLAGKLGISQPRVCKLVNDPDWNFGRGPWSEKDLQPIRTFLDQRRALNNATAGAYDEDGQKANDDAIQALTKNPERVARIKLIIERTAAVKLDRELKAGGYVKKEDIQRDAVAKVYAVRAKLQEIPLRAALVAHKGEQECAAILADWMKEVCDHFSGSN